MRSCNPKAAICVIKHSEKHLSPQTPLKLTSYITAISTITILFLAINSCSKAGKSNSNLEGTITYDLTYPYEANSVMMDLYPTQMILHFKGEKIHSEIKSSYNLLTNDIIIDNENRTFIQLIKNMSNRQGMKLNESETLEWYKRYPNYQMIPTDEAVTIAGYVCKKTIARPDNDSLPSIELYHTKGLGISSANWWNPFNKVDGFLLGYDLEQYGMCMRFRAKEVKFELVEDSKFAIPESYEMSDASNMDTVLKSVIDEFVK